jgi:hypothetical protein
MQNLSTKEVNYIKDVMSWELLAAKKNHQYSCQEDSASRKQLYADTAKMHQQNYLCLLNYIGQIVGKQGGKMQ